MKIILKIKGMHCDHCKMRVEKALSGISGAGKVEVSLMWKKATIEAEDDIPDALLRDAVSDAGFEVTAIERKN